MDLVIKIFADYLIFPLILLAGYLLLFKVPKRGRYDKYTHILMAGLTSYWLAKVIGNLWQPEKLRPFEILGITPGASFIGNAGFPSDHVLFAAFLTGAVWYGTRHKWFTITMASLTILLGIARVLAHVHTVLDVAGGIVIALAGAVWYLEARKKPSLYKTSKKTKEVV